VARVAYIRSTAKRQYSPVFNSSKHTDFEHNSGPRHQDLLWTMYPLRVIGTLVTLSFLATALPCSSPFFDLTTENFKASEVATYYASWAATASLKPEFISLGEVRSFFHDHLGAGDVECGVSRMGCVGLPSCERIQDLVGDAEVARKIYFVGRLLDNMSLFAGLVYVSPPHSPHRV
jgi:hypothetical protein